MCGCPLPQCRGEAEGGEGRERERRAGREEEEEEEEEEVEDVRFGVVECVWEIKFYNFVLFIYLFSITFEPLHVPCTSNYRSG